MVVMKGLMGRCLNHETTLERVRVKAEAMVDELSQLKNWKSTMEKKFDFSKERKELKQRTEEMKKVLEGKDKKIKISRASSVRLRTRPSVNIATPTPYSRSWVLPSRMVLMVPFVKFEKPILA